MRLSLVVLAACCLVSAPAAGQWSEPQLVSPEGPFYAEAGGPRLAATRGDTVWATWISEYMTYNQARAGFCTGDSWSVPDSLGPGEAVSDYWPAIAADDSGRPVVAWYHGSYPTVRADFDTWGIYVTRRTGAGWEPPTLAVRTRQQTFPKQVTLARGASGALALVWCQSPGLIGSLDSIVISRKTPTGWTRPRCLLPGLPATSSYWSPTLCQGDASEFMLAYSTSGFVSESVHVWWVDDTLIERSLIVRGWSPALAHWTGRDFLVFLNDSGLYGCSRDTSGWTQPQLISTDVSGETPGLCVDPAGYAWAVWTGQMSDIIPLYASYCRGGAWSQPETIALPYLCSNASVVSNENGVIYVAWDDADSSGIHVKAARRLTTPGTEEKLPDTRGRMQLTAMIVRGVLSLPRASGEEREAYSVLVDITGRKAEDLVPGANDVRHLSPGVYFLRATDGDRSSKVRKVIIQR